MYRRQTGSIIVLMLFVFDVPLLYLLDNYTVIIRNVTLRREIGT